MENDEKIIKDEQKTVLVKSKKFAARIIKLAEYLRDNKKAYVLADQVLRSGTSIGANLSEGKFSQSGADFYTKFKIALKEASETDYWLEIMHDTGYLDDIQYKSIHSDCDEIISMLVAITKTLSLRL